MANFRSRIVGQGTESPEAILANPRNWRGHPKEQEAALEGLMREVGWVQQVIVNRTTGHLVDGHLRVELARRRGEAEVPVIYVELSEEEEALVLATIDPIGGLASTNDDILRALLDDVSTDDAGLQALLDQLADGLPDLDDEGDGEGGDGEGPGSLSDRFMIPPFSVLNAREGWWQDRKRWWLGLGIKSELGRGDGDDAGGKETGGLLMRSWTSHPEFYGQKTRKEAELGRELSTAEFLEKHFVVPEDSLSSGTSIFDPVLCEIAYRWFSPPGGVVLDPFAGGSVRGVVASRLGRQYVGHELRGEQVAANRVQADEICAEDEHPPAWIEGDSRMIDRTCADVDADFVFSCPPYADLEVYSDDPADLSTLGYEGFREAYFEIIAKACARLRDNRFACFVVGEVRDKRGNYYDFVGDTVEAFRRAGLHYYNEAILVTAVGSLPIRAGKQFATSRKLGKTHQNVLVFLKGDAKKAVDACGEVEVPEEALERASADGDPAAEFGEVMA